MSGIITESLPPALENTWAKQIKITSNGIPLSDVSNALWLNIQDLKSMQAWNGNEIRSWDVYRRENHKSTKEIVIYRVRDGRESVVCVIKTEVTPHPVLPLKLTRQEDNGYYTIGNLTIAPQNLEDFTNYLGTVVNKYINYMVNRNWFDRVMDMGRNFLGKQEFFFNKLDYKPLADFFWLSKFEIAKTKFIALVQSIDKNKSA